MGVDVQLKCARGALQERGQPRSQLGPQRQVRQVVQAGRVAGRTLGLQQRVQRAARALPNLRTQPPALAAVGVGQRGVQPDTWLGGQGGWGRLCTRTHLLAHTHGQMQ